MGIARAAVKISPKNVCILYFENHRQDQKYILIRSSSSAFLKQNEVSQMRLLFGCQMLDYWKINKVKVFWSYLAVLGLSVDVLGVVEGLFVEAVEAVLEWAGDAVVGFGDDVVAVLVVVANFGLDEDVVVEEGLVFSEEVGLETGLEAVVFFGPAFVEPPAVLSASAQKLRA